MSPIVMITMLSLHSIAVYFLFGWIGAIYISSVVWVIWLIPSARAALGFNLPVTRTPMVILVYFTGIIWAHLLVWLSSMPILIALESVNYSFSFNLHDSLAFGDSIIPFLLALMVLICLKGVSLDLIALIGISLTSLFLYVEFGNIVDYLVSTELPWGWEAFSVACPNAHFYLLFTGEWVVRLYVRYFFLMVFARHVPMLPVPHKSMPPALMRFVERHLLHNHGIAHPHSPAGLALTVSSLGFRRFLVDWYHSSKDKMMILHRSCPALFGPNNNISSTPSKVFSHSIGDYTLKVSLKDVSLPSLPASPQESTSLVTTVMKWFSS